MIRQNLHTHSIYDDGKDAPADMARKAEELGFSSLGFSGHSPVEGDPSTMTMQSMELWKNEVRKLQRQYKNLQIYLGIELDTFSEIDTDDFDYIIGSVHYLEENGRQWAVDESRQQFERMLEESFHGNIDELLRRYYASIEKMLQTKKLDICGHVDLIGKFNEDEQYFSFDDPAVLDLAMKAVRPGIERGIIFEINTGAISRGYRSLPYPHPALLERMAKEGALFTLSSDCHHRDDLDCFLPQAALLARKAGVSSLMVLEENGFRPHSVEEFLPEQI